MKPLYTHDQLLQYGDARALAAREQAIEEWRVHLLALWEKGDFDLKDALAASPQEQTSAVPVVEQLLSALMYHRDQTRPINTTTDAIAAGRQYLKENGK